jgi:uncharacterized protein
MSEPPESVLEALRAQSGLSIDLDGRFLHRGEPITHERTLEVLYRSLARATDGRYLVTIGRESGYVMLEDAPYAVRGLLPGADGPELLLSDGSREPLRPESLAVDDAGVLHCRVRGDHRARFTRSAQLELGLQLEPDESAPGGYALPVGGRRHPLGKGPG